MILDSKHTTVAYRCPHCGAGVISAVNVFSLSADMVKLKCTCGKSEMSIVSSQDEKIRLTVPCMLCATPHTFTVNSSLFYGKDIFSLACPYASDFPLAFFGEINLVKGELARAELALLDMMEKNGLVPPDEILDDENMLPDPQILDIVMFVINDMDAEGKIYCKCAPDESGRDYEVDITAEGVSVTCKKCGASRTVPTDSRLSAYAFLNADALYLEEQRICGGNFLQEVSPTPPSRTLAQQIFKLTCQFTYRRSILRKRRYYGFLRNCTKSAILPQL